MTGAGQAAGKFLSRSHVYEPRVVVVDPNDSECAASYLELELDAALLAIGALAQHPLIAGAALAAEQCPFHSAEDRALPAPFGPVTENRPAALRSRSNSAKERKFLPLELKQLHAPISSAAFVMYASTREMNSAGSTPAGERSERKARRPAERLGWHQLSLRPRSAGQARGAGNP